MCIMDFGDFLETLGCADDALVREVDFASLDTMGVGRSVNGDDVLGEMFGDADWAKIEREQC